MLNIELDLVLDLNLHLGSDLELVKTLHKLHPIQDLTQITYDQCLWNKAKGVSLNVEKIC